MKHLKFTSLIAFAMLLIPLAGMGRTFNYNYRGITFECKVKNGTVIICSFDTRANKVIIPAKVEDPKTRQEYSVSVVDLFSYNEFPYYDASMVAIEKGVQEIGERCFYGFNYLSNIYIPTTVERIGKKAFNPKHLPTFTMPSSISEKDLAEGLVVTPRVEHDIMADIDISAYTNDPVAETNPKEKTANPEKVVAPIAKKVTPGNSDIDFNIPRGSSMRDNTFCIIIANENYQKKNTPEVSYAATDGATFQKYCISTLGVPSENTKLVTDATYLEMKDIFGWLRTVAEVYGNDANFIVYYAGHGVPDEKGNCYLLPVDGDINKPETNGYSLKALYQTLGEITTKSALVLIDACFSGNDRNDLSMSDGTGRGFTREIKDESVTGNVVALTAASNSETALAYNEKGHGMFSYFLMKKLQDTKGNVTYGELHDYIKKEVMRRSVVSMSKRQTPDFHVSPNIQNSWRNIKF